MLLVRRCSGDITVDVQRQATACSGLPHMEWRERKAWMSECGFPEKVCRCQCACSNTRFMESFQQELLIQSINVSKGSGKESIIVLIGGGLWSDSLNHGLAYAVIMLGVRAAAICAFQIFRLCCKIATICRSRIYNTY